MNLLNGKSKLLVISLASCIMTATAFGAPIIGTLNFAGGVRVSSNTIDFLPLVGGGSGTGAADVTTNTGYFAGMNTGNPAAPGTLTIKDLTGGPVTGSTSVPAFLSGFSLLPNLVFDVTYIDPGVYSSANCFGTAAAGNTCTPVGSPFNLSDILSGGRIAATISLGLSGTVRNTLTGDTGGFTGVFSQQVDGTSYESILNMIQTPGAFFQTSYSATFTANAVPEPATWAMLLSGLAIMGISIYSKRRAVRN